MDRETQSLQSEIFSADCESNIILKFFNNPLFCSTLQSYLSNEYSVICQIKSENDSGLPIKFSGSDANVICAQNYVKRLSQIIETKIYNNEITDKSVIYWSQNIHCDSTIEIIQTIFDNQNVFTVWEKTDILFGYYAVHCFNSSSVFHVSKNSIDRIINNEIAFVQDLTISNFDVIHNNFRNELEDYINETKQQQEQLKTIAIIYCIYPYQQDLKISLFGQDSMVKKSKKRLEYLLEKHRMIKVNINFNLKQRQYVSDNCLHELKQIELKYKNDKVEICIRQNMFYSPQYLTLKIKKIINSLAYKTAIIEFQHISYKSSLAKEEKFHIELLAQKSNCEIEKIEEYVRKDLIDLYKSTATSTLHFTSKYLIEESNKFISNQEFLAKLTLSNGIIEICKYSDIPLSKADIIISSVDSDYISQRINLEQSSVEIKLVIPWIQVTGDAAKMSYKEFISQSLERASIVNDKNRKKLAFSTKGWENHSNQTHLAKHIIDELKAQIDKDNFSQFYWVISIVFDNDQSEMYHVFRQIVLSINSNINECEQIYYPISTIRIYLKSFKNQNIIKFQNIIYDYIQRNSIKIEKIDNPFDPLIWNQHMINVFYQYCIKKQVLPKSNQIHQSKQKQHYRLDLIGLPSAVLQTKQKYDLMSEIMKYKHERLTDQAIKKTSMRNKIIIVSCHEDVTLSNYIADHLTDDGYLVSVSYSCESAIDFRYRLEQTDFILVNFSPNYSKTEYCREQMEIVKRVGRTVIPITLRQKSIGQANYWLDSVISQDIYYEIFGDEIKFQLDEDFDFEYDQILVELYRSTKSNDLKQEPTIVPIDLNEINVNQQDLSSPAPAEQIDEKRKSYEKNIEKLENQNKIPDEEVKRLTESLLLVIEDYKSDNFFKSENEIDEIYGIPKENYWSLRYRAKVQTFTKANKATARKNLNDLVCCIQRWIDTSLSGHIIKGNLPPFTTTGDFNDAIHPISYMNRTPWWEASKNFKDFDHSPPNMYFNYPPFPMSSRFTYDEAEQYYRTLINRDFQFQREKLRIHRSLTKTKYSRIVHQSDFTNEWIQGEMAWDIKNDRLILNYYKRKTFSTHKSLWKRIVARTIKLLQDIEDGKIDLNSDTLQGKIGNELKTAEDLEKLDKLDNPNSRRWAMKQPRYCTREFLEAKIQNTIEFQKLCNDVS